MSQDPTTRQDDAELMQYLAAGGKLTSPDNVTPRYRGEVMHLMAVFVDSEMAGASGFADCINLAPGVKERIVAARIVLEKFGHAEKVLKLMEVFGANTSQYVTAHPWSARLDRSANLGTRRIDGDMRLNVFHYPIYGWGDAVVMNMLMGIATTIQIDDLSCGSYQPFAATLLEILPHERRHAQFGEAGARAILASGYDPIAAQASVNYWYPRVAETFGRGISEHADSFRKFGLRLRNPDDQLASWRAEIAERLTSFGLSVPA